MMKRVLLYGNSLLISGLQASLGVVPGLDLQQMEPLPDRICERIKTWQPDVLILETGLLENGFSLVLLQDLPQIKLIGLDIEEERLVVLSSSTAKNPTTEDLLQLIIG
jgi:hypothetical protein